MTTPSAPLALPHPDGYGAWVEERCRGGLAEAERLAAELREAGDAPAERVLDLWDGVTAALAGVLSLSSLIANVHPAPAVRELAEQAEQDAHRLLTALSLDRRIHDALAGSAVDGLDADARRFRDRSLRDFRRAGVDRDEETRDRLRALSERQTEIVQLFDRNIREAVGRLRVDPHRLAGLPEDFLAAHPAGDDGLVELTTEYPDYTPVMTFCRDRSLREEMLAAFLNRAWPDNDEVLHDLLDVRRLTAELLGYADWPAYDAEVKMIGSGDAIPAFIDRVTELAEEPARRDFGVLLERVRQDRPGADTVDGVDKSFYAEVVRRERFDVDAQEVRRYFAFPKVRQGLLDVTGRLFGVGYRPVDGARAWHPEVVGYDVVEGETVLGRIYLDLHPREGKYSHAAQFTLVDGIAGRRLPEGVLVCNFPRGLMEHDQVVTLFHEFGHLLHHVLGGHQRWARFSGVATEWDFVEAPSQMLEEWAWDHRVLATFATDEAGSPIPSGLVGRMREAEEFGKGYLARTQMLYAAISYWFHRQVPADLTATVRRLQETYDLFGYVPDTHFHASFGHLGSYGSGYYTYMWSLVIAKDLFSAFDPDDLFDERLARRYRRSVLEPGGSRDAADLVREFLGRPSSFEAFERWLAS